MAAEEGITVLGGSDAPKQPQTGEKGDVEVNLREGDEENGGSSPKLNRRTSRSSVVMLQKIVLNERDNLDARLSVTDVRQLRTTASLGRFMLSRRLTRAYLEYIPKFRLRNLLLFAPYGLFTAIIPIFPYLLPMVHPELGYSANWLFAYVVAPLVSFFGFFMVRRWFETNLRCTSNGNFLIGPVLGAGITVLCSSLMGIYGIFPVPFAFVGIVVPGIIVCVTIEFFCIPYNKRNNFEKLKSVAIANMSMAMMVMIALLYMGYRVLWLRLDNSQAQGAFSLLLPLLKFVIRYAYSMLMVRFRVDTVPCIGYFIELYDGIFHAVLLLNHPSTLTFVVLILADWVQWAMFYWDIAGINSKLRFMWIFDRYDYPDSAANSPERAESEASSAPSTASQSLTNLAYNGERRRSSTPSAAGASRLPALEMQAIPEEGEPTLPPITSGSFAVAELPSDLLYMNPRQRRKHYVAAFAAASVLLQIMVPLQYLFYFLVAYQYTDKYNFYFLECVDAEAFRLGIILNCVDLLSQVLASCIFVPLIWKVQGVNLLSFGYFFIKKHWKYYVTVHITTLISVFGISLKHYGTDFSFNFVWLQPGYNSTIPITLCANVTVTPT